MQKKKLIGKTLDELKSICTEYNLPKFTAKQITEWIYIKRVKFIDEMTNISKKNRDILNDNFELGLIDYTNVHTSKDGTKKYLFPTDNSKFIETAYIPDKNRSTLCVSSQVGCKMNCSFCMTGKQGFQSNLTSADIINQILNFPESEKLTNIVYMGMGEPLDNLGEVLKSLEILTSDYGFAWSPKRITVSSIGIIPKMIEFLDKSNCHLAISMHNPFDYERAEFMPVQKSYPISEIIDTLKNYDFTHQRRVSFEYIMFKDISDQPRHIKKIVSLLDGIKCRINLIRWHTIPGADLAGSDELSIENFKNKLNARGITTTIRASRGQDIDAACGLLSTKELNSK